MRKTILFFGTAVFTAFFMVACHQKARATAPAPVVKEFVVLVATEESCTAWNHVMKVKNRSGTTLRLEESLPKEALIDRGGRIDRYVVPPGGTVDVYAHSGWSITTASGDYLGCLVCP